MSSNLVADLIAVGALYLIGRQFMARKLAAGIFARVVHVNDEDGVRFELVNYSNEPILDVACSLNLDYDYTMVTADGQVVEDLMPGQSCRSNPASPWRRGTSEDDEDTGLILFHTVRGEILVSSVGSWSSKAGIFEPFGFGNSALVRLKFFVMGMWARHVYQPLMRWWRPGWSPSEASRVKQQRQAQRRQRHGKS